MKEIEGGRVLVPPILATPDSNDSVNDLWPALRENRYAQMKQLLEGGADVRAATRPDGWSLLHDAAYSKGNLRMVKLLLQHNADVNARYSILYVFFTQK